MRAVAATSGLPRKRTRTGVVVAVRGIYRAPKGLTPAQACHGAVTLSVAAGPRHTGRRARVGRSCRFGGRVALRLPRAQARRIRAVTLRVRFLGNPLVAATARTYHLRVR